MITLRRAEQREHQLRERWEAWLTTFPRKGKSIFPAKGFSHLKVFEEGRLPPQNTRRQLIVEEAEILTYVHEGTLSYEDSTGRSDLISAGEFQRMTAGPGIRYGESNASPTEWAHVFQLWLSPSITGIGPGHEQKRFSAAERRGVMCVVASPDGQKGSLRIHQDAFLLSTILRDGQHIVHELSVGRCAWIQIVQGVVQCSNMTMRTGDGAAIKAEPAISMIAREESEVLLLDLGELASDRSIEAGGHD